LFDDPLYCQCFNEGLEWAARLVEEQTQTPGSKAKEFGRSLAASIRAARKPADFQIDFFDAIRKDLYMTPEQKDYWLSLEGDTKASAGGGPVGGAAYDDWSA
jgi:hypothetical protein